MSEGELIEISQRFRKLESLCEKADLELLARQTYKERSFRNGGGRQYEREAEEIEYLRGDIERQLEACKEDLKALMELVRRKVAA